MSFRSGVLYRITDVGRCPRAVISGAVIAGIFAVVLGGSQAVAHHSFAATYHEDQRVTIEGRVLQFQFRNPHSFIHIQAPDEDGEMHRWSVEWSSPATLSGEGVDRATLRPGDIVQVTGAPGRNPSDHRMVLRRIYRPADGYEFDGETD
jgi:hypothetical protein